MSSELIISTEVERTPEEKRRGAEMHARESAQRRNRTQQMLDDLDPGGIYYVYDDGDVRKVEVVKSTPKQYKVKNIGRVLTLPRGPIDNGETVTIGKYRESFALGRSVQPDLQRLLTAHIQVAEHCAQRLEKLL